METSIQHQFDNEECKDSIDYVYMGWRILVIIIALSVGMLMVYRLIHEVKREYIDYFKIIQYVNIIMHSFFTTLALIIFLCFPRLICTQWSTCTCLMLTPSDSPWLTSCVGSPSLCTCGSTGTLWREATIERQKQISWDLRKELFLHWSQFIYS